MEELIPHRSPMILLDKVLSWDRERIVCTTTPRDGSPFVSGGRARAVVTLEYMAQCVAALAGLLARERGEEIRLGLLVAVRQMDLARDWINVGAILVVEAERVWGDAMLGHFKCSVRERCDVFARAALSVVREDARGFV